jgi:hypothetical protein
MKPLNLDNSPCSPTSSNCIIWQGPNIPCIKLCTGDTITDVVYALATQLCTLVDQVNISTLDLSCLNITTGTPTNINDLLQILINKICALNNIPVPTGSTNSDGCPTNCVVDVAECLRTGTQTTMKLLEYVQLIGNRICSILSDITSINSSITNLTSRVTALESVPPTPPYILPPITPDCTLAEGSIIGGLTYPLELVLTALINDNDHGYCALLGSLGQPNAIITAFNLQTVDGTDGALSNCSLTLAQLFSTTWITTPQNLSQSFIDLWLVVKDIRDAYKRYNVTAGNSNVTVTTTTTPGTCGPEVSFAVKAKSSSVVAGTNISSVNIDTTNPDNTVYTVNAKNTTVAAGDNITVSTNTTDPTNTIYTVTGKEAIVQASTNSNNLTTVTPSSGPGAGDTTYTVETLYGLDSFVAAIVVNSDRQPVSGVIPFTAPGAGVSIGSDMQMLSKYNIVNVNGTITDAGLIAGAYVTSVTTLPFGTFDNVSGEVLITTPGTYQITGALQIKGATSGAPIWQTLGIGSFHLGLLSDSDNVFTGQSQHVQGPMTLASGSTPLTIPGIHTTISLNATATVWITSNTVVRLGVFNFTDRNYNGNTYASADIMRFAITRLR